MSNYRKERSSREDFKHSRQPSSGHSGFFQVSPRLENAFNEDITLRRIFAFYLPKHVQDAIEVDLLRFGSLVLSPDLLKWTANAEANPPSVQNYDTWGRRVDNLVTSEGWRSLQKLGFEEGIVAIGYENEYGPFSRLYQFLKYHMWIGSSAMVVCPSALQDGAACLLKTQLERNDLPDAERKVFERAYGHLTSRDPREAWTSGQWMTERSGGSDVRNTETQATYDPVFTAGSSIYDTEGTALGPWSLTGFKWFSSATDSNMTVMLARDPSGSISAFYAPMRRRVPSKKASPAETELNGIQIQRLKSKLGTKAVPTAELVLQDTRAYLLGELGKGVKAISKVLNITRVHTAMGCVGYWGRGLAIARAFALVRSSSGRLLVNVPAHVRTLAEQHIEYRAMMQLSFFSVALLGAVESDLPAEGTPVSHLFTPKTAPDLFRLVTPLAKALAAKAAIAGLAECMESLGGVGYLENEDPALNIARMLRDVNVNSIWEGTTDVLAYDVVRVLKGPTGSSVVHSLEAFIQNGTENWHRSLESDGFEPGSVVVTVWQDLKHRIESKDAEELVHNGRDLARGLGWVICAVLLGENARYDGDLIAGEIFRRYISRRQKNWVQECTSWKHVAEWDRRLVFGLVAEGSKL